MKSNASIVRYTRAVLEAVCKQRGLTKKQLRLATLKRVGCELGNLLENSSAPLHDADREVLGDLHEMVRLALGDE